MTPLETCLCVQVNFDGSRPAQTEGEAMVLELQRGGHEIDRKLDDGRIQMFKDSEPLNGAILSARNEASSETEEDELDADTDNDAGRSVIPYT